MDGSRFDRITKTLADHTPRREAVKALAGSGIAAVVARFGFDAVEAGKKSGAAASGYRPAVARRSAATARGGSPAGHTGS